MTDQAAVQGVQLYCRPLRSGAEPGRQKGRCSHSALHPRAAAPDTGGAQALHPDKRHRSQAQGAERGRGRGSEDVVPRRLTAAAARALGAEYEL